MICKYCGNEREESEFKVTRIIKGVTYFRKKCQPCKNLEQNGRRIKHRDIVQELKKELKCEECGFSDYRALDFHHKDPLMKDKEVANMVHYSLENIKAEIA